MIKSSTALNLFITLSEINEISFKGRGKIIFYSYVCEKLKINLIDEDSELVINISNYNFNCDISGYGFVELNGMFNTCKLNIYDDVTVTLDVISENLICNMSGNSFGNFFGVAELFSATMFDEAYLKAFNLLTKECYIDMNDISEAQINVSDKLHISGLNNGFVQYKGDPIINLLDLTKSIYIKNRKDKSFLLGEN